MSSSSSDITIANNLVVDGGIAASDLAAVAAAEPTKAEVDAGIDTLSAALVKRQDNLVGRVLAKHIEPRGLLNRVHSSFEGSGFTKTSQMPGTATKGFSDMITLTDEVVADQIVVVNIKIQ